MFVGGLVPAPHQEHWIECGQALAEHRLRNPEVVCSKCKPVWACSVEHSTEFLLIIAPPGSAKTTIFGILYTAWRIGLNSERHYGVFSYADQVAWDRSRAVRDLIERDRAYRITFPNVLPDRKHWGVQGFRVMRNTKADPHPTLRAGGATSSVVAYRLNGGVFDDPHDPKNSSTPLQLDKVWTNWEDAISTRLTADAWWVGIGTRWGDQDWLGHCQKQKKWHVVHVKAMKGNGDSYWPEHYPREFLLKKKEESPALFALQYQGDTRGGAAQIIRFLRCWDTDGALKSLTPHDIFLQMDLVTALALDTALKDQAQNDYTVGYVGGMDKYGRILILDRIKGRFTLPELMDLVNDKFQEWDLSAVWVEDAPQGTPAVQMLMEQMPHIPSEAVPIPRGGKLARRHALSPFLHGGHVLFPKAEAWFPDSEYELTNQNTGHDDDPDALWILVSKLTQFHHPSYTSERPNISIEMG